MDKRKATLTLTEKLNELGCISMVTEPAVKSYLLSNAKSVVLDLKKGGRVVTHCVDPYYFSLSNFESETISRSRLPIGLSGYTAANYFFTEKHYDSSGSRFFATPAAVVGKAEERVLREIFYKNVPDNVLKAFEALQLPNFVEQYKNYLLLFKEQDVILLKDNCVYIPFEEGMKVELGDIIQGAKSKNYYVVEEIEKEGDIKGHRFEDTALTIPSKEGPVSDCSRDNLIKFKKKVMTFNPSFLEFVFNLPDEDKNLIADKVILKSIDSVIVCDVLMKEYSRNKIFKEYFSDLSKDVQEKAVEKIKCLPNQNTFLNSWLFSQGFDVKMSH
ncbi:MAG: hypothetical protein Q8O03_00685, partial [Nanoarchaeota archaeon]|nr:hypothetical protein [Nanoarchaeota archaeon]